MSSILTNSSAMVALQTLKGINSSLSTTQSQISTGKTVSSAKDNAAVWAISKTMETDVQAFKDVSDSLALGETTVSVARKASETVTSLLGDMREKIVNAQGDNVDRNKLQTDIVALREQIASVVGAAQFNGLNLVDGSTTSTNVLSSLDRASNGTVSASSITVTGQDLSIGSYAANDVFSAGSGNATVSGNADTFALSIDSAATDTVTIQDGATAWAAGDKVSMQIGDKSVSYTVSASDVSGTNSVSDLVAIGLKTAIDGLGISGLTVNYDSANPGELSFDNQTGNDLSVTGQFANAGAGGLGGLSAIDVSSVSGATAALGSIDALIATAVDATAAFGSVEGRISTQADFISSLSDSVKSGIGSLVDADMEEASARLQALQTQQQLGISSLSIANQQPQNILSLFR